jgi:heme-degrading monooxygenase HmoA
MPTHPLPTTEAVTPSFVVLYRWRLREGAEDSFVEAWARMTDALRARGSLGSRLHRGSDGVWYSYAQWPSARTRDEAFAQGPADPTAVSQMRAAISESLPEIILDVVADHIGPA